MQYYNYVINTFILLPKYNYSDNCVASNIVITIYYINTILPNAGMGRPPARRSSAWPHANQYIYIYIYPYVYV